MQRKNLLGPIIMRMLEVAGYIYYPYPGPERLVGDPGRATLHQSLCGVGASSRDPAARHYVDLTSIIPASSLMP